MRRAEVLHARVFHYRGLSELVAKWLRFFILQTMRGFVAQ
jgi:hypothetical protein